MNKNVIGVSMAPSARQAGNAYATHLLFGAQGLGRQMNPVIGADYVPPMVPDVQAQPLQTEAQAMRGCECVTLVLQGSIRAQDSAGHEVLLQEGDVEWLTAGSGLLRKETAQAEGTLELAHVLVNLPAQYKMTPPHQQHLPNASIPVLQLPDDAGTVRVIAGEYAGTLGPAETVGPLQLWTMDLRKGHATSFQLPRKWYAVLLVQSGRLEVNYWPHPVTERQLVVVDSLGDQMTLTAWEDTRLMLVSAEPLDEPIAGSEGLILNTQEELDQTLLDLEAGQFGSL